VTFLVDVNPGIVIGPIPQATMTGGIPPTGNDDN